MIHVGITPQTSGHTVRFCLLLGMIAAGFSALAPAQTIVASETKPPAATAPPALPLEPPPACTAQGPVADWDAASKLVAGIDMASYEASFSSQQKAAWADYAKTSAQDWARLKLRYMDRISQWRSHNLSQVLPETALYPFSGPDATNALAFFPDAKQYVLIGLERPGCVPSEADDFAPEYWAALRNGWQSAVSLGFFITADMRHDLYSGASGVLPVLLFMISRAGNTVIDVVPTVLTSGGQIVAAGTTKNRIESRGIAIRFRPAGAPVQDVRTLHYIASNLANYRLQAKPGTVKYLSSLGSTGVLVKSASYLMHKRTFSQIRGIVLSRAAVVVEDDSGIPYQFFGSDAWDVRLYGSYDSPISLFQKLLQEDLKAAYEDTHAHPPTPLSFGFGYKWRLGESNLLVAFRRNP